MKKLMLALLLLSFSRSFADDWFCKQGSSRVLNSEIQACGVGYRYIESEARTDALYRAMDEFVHICKGQSDSRACLKRGWTVVPERTECEDVHFKKGASAVKCYRMVRFVFNQ